MTKTVRQIAEEVAYELMGSSKSLLSALEHREREDLEMNTEFCAVIDSLVFECTDCGWWCGIDEMEGDWTCGDCT